MKEKVLKNLIIISSIILFFAAIVSVLFVMMIKGSDRLLIDYINDNFKKIEHRNLVINTNPFADRDDIVTIQNDNSNQEFKIMQITDMHINASMMTIERDKKSFDAVYQAIQLNKPDFLVVTGDMLYPNYYRSFSLNNLNMAKAVGSFFDKISIPWTFTYGNHDDESYATNNKSDITKCLTSFDSCVFKKGLDSIDGQGNFVINLLNYDGSMNSTLILMDSHSYRGTKYDHIHQNQVTWLNEICDYLKVKNSGEYVKSHLFFHIPMNEFATAWKMVKDSKLVPGQTKIIDGKEVIYHFGVNDEKTCDSPYQVKELFDVLKSKNIISVYCGHDHMNNASITYDGVRLTYGMSIDYSAYPNINHSTKQRGVTLLTINKDSEYNITHLPQDNNWTKKN